MQFSTRTQKRRQASEFRSARWYGADTMRAFAHRQRMQQMGMRREEFIGRPVIAIVNTWSDLWPPVTRICGRRARGAIKRGVIRAGGLPGRAAGGGVARRGDGEAHHQRPLPGVFLVMEVEELLRASIRSTAVLLWRLRQDHAGAC